jgi:L-aminopeptidase/D-esterase-like protein
MEVLRERDGGFVTPFGKVPIVPAAILFDLHTGVVRPDRESGAAAARAASDAPLSQGRLGAGAGAMVGGATGVPVPGGLGSASFAWGEHHIGAVAAVNAVGAVRDPATGTWVAGEPVGDLAALQPGAEGGQTTLACIATDAPLTRPQLTVMARMASAGMARTLFPAFSAFDGDIVFSVGTGADTGISPHDLVRLGHLAAEAVALAIVRGVTTGR